MAFPHPSFSHSLPKAAKLELSGKDAEWKVALVILGKHGDRIGVRPGQLDALLVAGPTWGDGVVTGVKREDLAATALRMHALAERHDLSRDIIIQPQLRGRGEVLIGAQSGSPLGPIVLFGLGGIFVEALADVSARSAPFTAADASDMVAEIRGHKVLQGIRGQDPWDVEALIGILVGFSQLAAATSTWLESVEINPLMVTDNGYAAVDVSCILRSSAANPN